MLLNKSCQYQKKETRYRIKDKEKALIYQHICEARTVTRKQIALKLKIRPTSVSHTVQEMISDNLVFEGEDRNPGTKGRPEISLHPNFNRFTVIVIYVVSRELKGVLVNLGHEILAEKNMLVPGDSGNKILLQSINDLINTLSSAVPDRSELAGFGLSLPGTVNIMKRMWISAARWPLLRNLSLKELRKNIPMKFSLYRALDAELEYLLLEHREYREGGTLLFHWGYGIGSAYAYCGTVLRSSLGRFGEIGHVPVYTEKPKKCFCGSSGCLETEAALWSLLPELTRYKSDIPEDEDQFADFLKREGSESLPPLKKAADFVCSGLLTLYRIFYPDRILIYGPFIRSRALFSALHSEFMARIPEYAKGSVSLEALSGVQHRVIFGSSYSFFREALQVCLTARWDK